MSSDLRERIIELSEGNPGALRVLTELLWFTRAHMIFNWLEAHGYTGEKIWMLYKDEWEMDSMKLGHWIEQKIPIGGSNNPFS